MRAIKHKPRDNGVARNITFKQFSLAAHRGDYLFYGFESRGNVIVPPHYQPKMFCGDTLLWILPKDAANGCALKLSCGAYKLSSKGKNIRVDFIGTYTKQEYPSRPACDFFGNALRLNIQNGEDFEAAFAHFYWDNLLPQIAERSFLRKKEDIRDGYVLSTLNKKAYAGTYPAVDHEFHMKGRFAVGGAAEASLIRRMLELQFKVMREDKTAKSKNLCAIQPNGKREYDVWRKSLDKKRNAQMFRITANIELVEGVYNYYCFSKDLTFLKTNIAALERSCAYIESFIRPDGLLESHVYYEDQVIKDCAVAQAQSFAVNAFRLMSMLESLLLRTKQSEHYAALAKSLGATVVKDIPKGYWNPETGRFVDWLDADKQIHDHVHLLANRLPELFGLSTPEQNSLCSETLTKYNDVFKKFPSYVAAKIEDYTQSEIGVGGPYDLCAAGRYWCWDAEYLAFKCDGDALLRQLTQVSNQAKLDGYLMGERYDMNYVYYNTGKDRQRNWHGAELYYEYPNVFMYVLICCYLGVRRGFDCDLIIKPLIHEGTVSLDSYGISYSVSPNGIELHNISPKSLTIYLPKLAKKIVLASGEKSHFPTSFLLEKRKEAKENRMCF